MLSAVLQAHQVADHAAGHDLPHDGRDVAHGAQDGALVLRPGTVVARAVDGLHAHGLLVRPQDLQVADAALAALLADDAAQGVDVGLVDVAHAEPRGVDLVGATHGAYLPQTLLLAPLGNLQLLGYGVDGIHNVVWAGEGTQLLCHTVLLDEGGEGRDLATGVDVGHHLAHDVGLGLADGAHARHGLPVYVAGAHHVLVHQHQVPHAAAGQGHCAVGTHAAEAKHHDRGRL